MKPEALQSSLLGRAEFKAWNLQITGRRDLADMLSGSIAFLFPITSPIPLQTAKPQPS
jgi:hypothetical protein